MMNDLEKKVNELNFENINLKVELNTTKEKYEAILTMVQEMESSVKKAIAEKDGTIENLMRQLRESQKNCGNLQNNCLSLENKIGLLEDDLQISKKEGDELSKQVSELFAKENEYKLAIDTIYNESIEQRAKIMSLEDEFRLSKSSYENLIEDLQMRIEGYETEKAKLLEDFESLNFAMNYTNMQLEEKKNLNNELQTKVYLII